MWEDGGGTLVGGWEDGAPLICTGSEGALRRELLGKGINSKSAQKNSLVHLVSVT